MDMHALISELKRDEGERLWLYVDTVGKVTIGVGHNLTDRGISPAASSLMLHEDVEEAIADLNRYVPWWSQLDDVRARVLVNMCFNLGVSSLLGFQQTLAAIHGGAYDTAAAGMMASLWAKQVGPRATRLAEMMRTGRVPEVKP